ncbi:MAG: molybdate ABC transporter substrate-binding protein [Chloroflexi bacterium]|nr:molybdate ABC transporter substrate-binding protein [Chloroflexota bacterium]
MKAVYITIFILISITFISCEKDNNNQKVVIYAASSISDLLIDAYEIFKQKNDIEVSFNFGGSISLANQISKFDSPADGVIFIGGKPIRILEDSDQIDEEYRYDFLTNTLAFVGHKNSNRIDDLTELLLQSKQRIIIADPALAPLGVYSEEILSSNNMYNQLEKNLILASDAKSVLRSLENHNADYGIIYYSDFLLSKNLVHYEQIEEVSMYSVDYYMHIMKNTDKKKQANEFLKFLAESGDARFIEQITSRGLSRIKK